MHPMTFTWSYLAAVAAALILTPLAAKLARVLGIVDVPNARKIHTSPIPRAGGLAIAASLLLVTLPGFFGVWPDNGFGRLESQMLALLVSATSLLVVGLVDDVFGVSSKFKLLALVAASAAFCGVGGGIDQIILHGREPINLGLFAWPVTILWMTGICVSINFIDGLDGLAAGLSAIACAMIAIITLVLGGHPAVGVLSLALMGSLTGFLFYNFSPARVFMGDCGSLFVGFLIAGASVMSSQWVGSVGGLLLPALALSIPLLDTFFTLVRRNVLDRRSVFSAERGHIHHRLLDLGLGQRHAVLLMYGVSVVAAAIGLVAMVGQGWATVGGLALLLPLLGGLFRMSGSLRASDTIRAIRRNRGISREAQRNRAAFEEMQLRFRRAHTFDEWWQEVCAAAEALGFSRVRLPVYGRDGARRELRWARTDDELVSGDTVNAELPIPQRRESQPLRAEVVVASATFLESAAQRLALFSRLIEENSLKTLPTGARDESSSHAPGRVHIFSPDDDADACPRAFPPMVRVAIVHDFLYTYAGAEKVLEQILRVIPQADVFSLFDFLPEGERGFIRNRHVRTSFIQKMPFARRKHRAYLPLMPLAIEQLDVSAYDVVVSSSYLAAKGVLTRPDQLHICYCHSPIRFAWDLQHQYLGKSGLSWFKSLAARAVLHYIRSWDVRSANGVDNFMTNSNFVARRIEKVYRRRSTPVFPPVDVDRFTRCDEKQDFYVTASRLVPYKRIDLIVEAFSQMPDRKLIVIGEGPQFERIAAKAGPNVKMLGHQPHDRLKYYLQHAKAFVFAAEEDFGIVPVEAQACGTPVIAFGRGGVTESVIAGKTGIFFHSQTVEALTAAVHEFDQYQWDPAEIRANSERFSIQRFREQFSRHVRQEYVRFRARLVDQLDPTTLGLPELNDHAAAPAASFEDPLSDVEASIQ